MMKVVPACDRNHAGSGAVQLAEKYATRRFKTGQSGTSGKSPAFPPRALEEAKMPVFIMWAIPTVIVVGGVGYYLVRAVH
jgi:hypothetical protein